MTNTNSNKLYFIINPNAGYQSGKKEWPKISKLIAYEDFTYEFEYTNYTGHAEDIVTDKINEGYRKFIIVGGDGTLNEVINGIFKQKKVPTNDIYIGLFSIGTGNDWARYYNFSHDYNEAIDRIKWNQIKTQDIGKVTYFDKDKRKEAYFINIAGLCFDAIVVKTTNKVKERGKRTKFAYLSSLLKSLIKYKPWVLKININNKTLEGKFLSISIGNGKYSGGGMKQTPNAIINDGLFDVTIYANMRKSKMITNINKLYNGKILSLKNVSNYRTTNLNIESSERILVEIDGEIIKGNSYEFSIIPNSINIIA